MTNDRPQFRLELRPLFLLLRRILLEHGQTGGNADDSLCRRGFFAQWCGGLSAAHLRGKAWRRKNRAFATAGSGSVRRTVRGCNSVRTAWRFAGASNEADKPRRDAADRIRREPGDASHRAAVSCSGLRIRGRGRTGCAAVRDRRSGAAGRDVLRGERSGASAAGRASVSALLYRLFLHGPARRRDPVHDASVWG